MNIFGDAYRKLNPRVEKKNFLGEIFKKVINANIIVESHAKRTKIEYFQTWLLNIDCQILFCEVDTSTGVIWIDKYPSKILQIWWRQKCLISEEKSKSDLNWSQDHKKQEINLLRQYIFHKILTIIGFFFQKSNVRFWFIEFESKNFILLSKSLLPSWKPYMRLLIPITKRRSNVPRQKVKSTFQETRLLIPSPEKVRWFVSHFVATENMKLRPKKLYFLLSKIPPLNPNNDSSPCFSYFHKIMMLTLR